MTPIIVSPKKQLMLANALAAHCKALDGTEIRIIEKHEGEDEEIRRLFPDSRFNTEICTRTYCLRKAALASKGQPFFWLEPDSIPLKAGWLKAIEAEYLRLSKPYMLTADSHPPHDLIGGIGVYGPECHWQIPVAFTDTRWSWDLWMIERMPNLVSRTRLIQHSYGIYDERGIASMHRFPRDSWMIRDDAVIFHRDAKQDLIPKIRKNVFVHSGHCGDLIAALPIVREMGGGKIIITQTPFTAKHNPMKGRLYESVAPLVAFQTYVDSVEWSDSPTEYSHDLREFRSHYAPNKTLTQAQADFLNEPFKYDPWLMAPIIADLKGKISVARSPRYQNSAFPWKQIVPRNRDDIFFLGTDSEHAAFVSEFGPVHHHKTKNLLEVASAIQSSKLFIGNQSSPCWVAMGLGHPLIQETNPTIRDSIVPRQNAMFVDGHSVFGMERMGVKL